MKHWIWLAGILGLSIAAIVISEQRKVDVPASPAAVLYLVADTEQELTRMPVNFTHISDEEEIRIGNELAKMYGSPDEDKNRAEVGVVERYLTQVGGVLAAHAHRKLPYRFHYVPNENMINAFALPGGHVYVGAGLLELMDSEDELAAVLGHEIEHIDHYHCAERAQQEEALRRIPLGGLWLFLSSCSKPDTARIRSWRRIARGQNSPSRPDTRRMARSGCLKHSIACTSAIAPRGLGPTRRKKNCRTLRCRLWRDISGRIRCRRSGLRKYRR